MIVNSQKLRKERTSILKCQEDLLWESDGGTREEIVTRKTELIDLIDLIGDSVSAASSRRARSDGVKLRYGRGRLRHVDCLINTDACYLNMRLNERCRACCSFRQAGRHQVEPIS